MRAPPTNNQQSGKTEPNNEEFAEFMWMEDMDSFDSQFLRELAEEDEMERCLEEMLAEERARETVYFSGQQQQQQQQQMGDYMGYIPYYHQGNVPIQRGFQQPSPSVHVSAEVVAKSKLNPCAKEFVPGRQVAVETSESSER